MAKSGNQKRRREAEAIQEQAIASAAGASDSNSAPPNKKARVEERRSLFVRSLPPSATSESLTNFFSEHFPVKHATVVLDQKTKTTRGYGFVTFTDADDALQAKEKLDNQLLDGRRLRLEIAEPRQRAATKAGVVVETATAVEKRKREEGEAEDRKPPKLIIRNLPWSIKTKEQLSELFLSFGKVKFADLPNDKGKLSGFGFVTIRGKKNAENAIEGLNGKEIDGRTIAVDYAVDKATWQQQQKTGGDTGAPPQRKIKDTSVKENKAKPDEASSKKKPKGDEEFDEDEDLKNFFANQGENLEDEDESDPDGKDDEDEDDEDEDEDEGGANVDNGDDEDAKAAETKPRITDNSTTLFIRNLPFTTNDEQLKEHFTPFGAVRYARVVMDHATQKPSGKGFVCFFNVEDAESCVRTAPKYQPAPTLTKHSVLQDETVDLEGKYTLEGRILQVSKAVSKGEAQQLTSEAAAARNSEEDKRRLYLLNEGQIRQDSPIYSLLPQSEIQLRETSAKQRKKMIESNPSLHLSLTRLAIRNIPHSVTSKDLKALARQAVVGFATDVKEGKREPLSKEENRRAARTGKEAEHKRKLKKSGVVSQAKVVFESKDGSKVSEPKRGDDGGAKSRGYGFVEYSSHRWALMGARWLNGRSVEGGNGKKATRLVVEFAIENANVIARRNTTQERSRFPPRAPTDRNQQQQQQAGDSRTKFNAGKGQSGEVEGEETLDGADDKSSKTPGTKLAMRQQIIGRKRMMRKKNAEVRKGKR